MIEHLLWKPLAFWKNAAECMVINNVDEINSKKEKDKNKDEFMNEDIWKLVGKY